MKFNSLITEFTVSNLEKSLEFYTKVLGFKLEYSREHFSFLSFQGSQIMISESDNWSTGKLEHPFGRGINFQIQVKKIDPLLRKLKKNKIKLFAEPEEKWYRVGKVKIGNKQFLVQDPDGYLLRFFEDLGSRKL